MLKPWAEASSWLLGPVFFFGSQLDPKELENPPWPGLFFVGWVRWEKGPFLSRKGWRCPISRNKFEVWSSYHKKPAKCGTKGWQGHWFIISFSTLKHFFSGGKLSLSSFFETVVCQLLFLEDHCKIPKSAQALPPWENSRYFEVSKISDVDSRERPFRTRPIAICFLGNGWNSPSQKHWSSRNQMYQDYEKNLVGPNI